MNPHQNESKRRREIKDKFPRTGRKGEPSRERKLPTLSKKEKGPRKVLSNLREWKSWWWAPCRNVCQGEGRQFATLRHWLGSEHEAHSKLVGG